MEKLTITETVNWLRERDGFLLLTHTRPDGDTLCSAAALAKGLRNAGKTAYIMKNPEATDRYTRYMGEYFAPDEFVPEHIVSVDTASEQMLTKGYEKLGRPVELAIDHHGSNTLYAERGCIDPSAAACGEMVYDIVTGLCGDIDAEIGKQLYIAVTTDTGCFVYANTTARTLYVASKAVEAGAPNPPLNKHLFRTKTKARFLLEGRIINAVQFFRDGAVAVAPVTLEMLRETGTVENDLDDIANIPMPVEGVQLGITVRENPDGTCKLSLRCRAEINANKIASHFGGGGHPMAAGCTLKGTPEEAIRLIIGAVEAEWPVS